MALSPLVGDLSRNLLLRQANNATKSELTTRMQEVTTGIRSDIPLGLGGDTRGLGHVESRLATLTAYDRAGTDLDRQARGMQFALEGVQDKVRLLGADMLLIGTSPSATSVAAGLTQARAHLDEVVAKLNTNVAGRFLFSGTETTTPPLASTAVLLADLQGFIGSPATAADLIAGVTAFFDAPPGAGGYVDTYGGDDNTITVAIAPGMTAGIDDNATAPAIRETLKGLTLLALAAEPPWDGNLPAQAEIMAAAGGSLIAADTGLALLRGDIGMTEGAVARAQTRNNAERTALNIERNDLTTVDPYEAISAATEAQTRLEAIYSMTARLSRLSLASYL